MKINVMVDADGNIPLDRIPRLAGKIIHVDITEHFCYDHHLKMVDSPANCIDYASDNCREGYQVKVCNVCGHIWGVRFQWDSGTGSDDDRKDFGVIDPKLVVRHM